MKELDSELFSNNVTFAIEGNEHAATRLKLSLNVNNAKAAVAAMESFASMVKVLIETEVPACEAEKLIIAARSGRARTLKVSNAGVQLTREDWRNNNLSGYQLMLVITHSAYSSVTAA